MLLLRGRCSLCLAAGFSSFGSRRLSGSGNAKPCCLKHIKMSSSRPMPDRRRGLRSVTVARKCRDGDWTVDRRVANEVNNIISERCWQAKPVVGLGPRPCPSRYRRGSSPPYARLGVYLSASQRRAVDGSTSAAGLGHVHRRRIR